MDKPFKTISQQIEILKSRDLVVRSSARFVLEREGYYPVVNGYKDPFLDPEAAKAGIERFSSGTSFANIYTLFCFDRDLRLTMFSYFARAEATFKAVCSYVFAEEFQDDGKAYLNPACYSDEDSLKGDIGNLIASFRKIIGYDKHGNLRIRRQYIQHYVTNHDCVPIWVLVNYLSLGQIFKFYCFQKESVRNKMAKRFSAIYGETHDHALRISPRRLRLAFDHIKDFRNICAHDERLYCAKVSPAKDTNLLGVFRDLSIVMTKSDTSEMIKRIGELMLGLAKKLGPEYSQKVFDAMGIADVRLLKDVAASS